MPFVLALGVGETAGYHSVLCRCSMAGCCLGRVLSRSDQALVL